MSYYSDWRVGALSDDEYRYFCNRENRMDRYYEILDMQKEYYNDDDVDYFDDDEYEEEE